MTPRMNAWHRSLFVASFLVTSSALAGCAAQAELSEDEDVAATEEELSALSRSFVGTFDWRADASGTFLGIERVELRDDGTYDAMVDSALVDPNVVCIRFPCTLGEAGRWSAFRSAGKTKIRLRPTQKPSRSYFASLTADRAELTLTRNRETSTLFATKPVANDCFRTGCSGHVCADRDIITTCEFREDYACYATATCERQPDGQCGFTPTAALSSCLADARTR